LITRAIALGAVTAVLFLANCSVPVDPSDRDLLEHERVWQFCKAFSLYQDQIPTHREALQEFEFPRDIVRQIPDTLHVVWLDTTFRIGKYDTSYSNLGIGGQAAFPPPDMTCNNHVQVVRLTDATLYMRIPEFLETTHDEVINGVRDYSGDFAIHNIVVDLINNPGGHVDACTASVEAFLPAGKEYLKVDYRETAPSSSRTVKGRVWSSKRTHGMLERLKVSILVNRGSASASEIFTVALRDALGIDRVYVVGDSTYGKAIGQYRFPLQSSGAGMSLTGLRFYRIDSTKPDYHEVGMAADTIFFGRKYGFSQAAFTNALKEAVQYWGDQDTVSVSDSAKSLFEHFHDCKRSLGKAAAFVNLGEQSIPEL